MARPSHQDVEADAPQNAARPTEPDNHMDPPHPPEGDMPADVTPRGAGDSHAQQAAAGLGRARSAVPHMSTDVLRQAHVNEVLRAHASELTTHALASMEQQLPWFSDLGADQRSWITLVSRSGIDGMVESLDHRISGDAGDFDVASVFRAAPSELTGQISLHQTVELMRTIIEVVEVELDGLIPEDARVQTQLAIMAYSRELAFAAAEIYARAAEMRGAWDARLEASVVDSIVRAEDAETVMSRAAAFGWDRSQPVCVVVGAANGSPASASDLRRAATRRGLDCLVVNQGDRMVAVVGGRQLTDDGAAARLAHELGDHFGTGHVVVGPVVATLGEASASSRAAISGLRAATAWPEGERIVSASDLLPERALAGDGHARRALVRDIYRPLVDAGGDLLETCVAFLDNGFSVEATARALFVHANTVRYRLKRVLDVTGYSLNDPRDAYVLRLAVTLGRLTSPERASA